MAEARERLRMDCLRGRILGNEDIEDDPPISDPFSLTIPEEDREPYQKSWKKSKPGRVKGLSSLFERPGESPSAEQHRFDPASIPRSPHFRHSSDQSDSSCESGSESQDDSPITPYITDWKSVEPLDLSTYDQHELESTLSSTPTTHKLAPLDTLSISTDEEATYDTSTIVPGLQISLAGTTSDHGTLTKHKDKERNTLMNVFDCAEMASEGMASVQSRNGSMIMVKKSQLAE